MVAAQGDFGGESFNPCAGLNPSYKASQLGISEWIQ